MQLSGLLPLLQDSQAFRQLAETDGSQPGRRSASVLDSAKPYLLAWLHRRVQKPVLVVTSHPEHARHLHEQLLAYLGDNAPVYLLPEPDALPYERLSSDKTTVHQRLWTLSRLAGAISGPAPLVVGSPYAVASKTLSPERLRRFAHEVRQGMKMDPLKDLEVWALMGYQPDTTVEIPGTMSRRGGIIDIYPLGSELPARIELFGDTVESIRLFDPATQRSLRVVESIAILPAGEVVLDAATKNSAKGLRVGSVQSEARGKLEEELRSLNEGRPFDGMEFYGPVFNSSTAIDYLPAEGLLVLDQPGDIKRTHDEVESEAKELRKALEARGELPEGFPGPYVPGKELGRLLDRHGNRLELEPFGSEETAAFSVPPSYVGRLNMALEEMIALKGQGQRVVVVSQQAQRLAELLQEGGIMVSPQAELAGPPPPGSITLVQGSLAEGWVYPDANTVLLTDSEVFGVTKQRRHVQKRAVKHQAFIAALAPGDYVVHIDHGVARFAGTEVRRVEGREREYLVLEYAAGDRIYLPMEQIDRVGPYFAPGDKSPSLTRLGGQEWARAKERAKAATLEIAKELLAVYASREVVQGHAFSPDTTWQQELEASFPYVETPDQLRTVDEVKADMERPKPMDRLVCGDVGYGKTEVAIRAAFKAIMDGMQVAVLVPTTILAQQHHTTFKERLAPFPLRVEVLSRFRSDKEQDEVVKALAEGAVDVCIGTHRLLQKDVAFKNLGLVVVDEEQRFGVVHKERLKQMRKEVDVLALSATPIPRTLYMSLAGVRDMSVMDTPPENRLPIKTLVEEFDEQLVREAVLREMERGGQVFFVHNRVYNIEMISEMLRRVVPEARVLVGHGQMPEERLERVMMDFAQGKGDVLVCTTIIESGLDMPNVNTLIVNKADQMGLAQLYQLRGRVGRGASRAYAYFLYGPDKQLTETAEKRLKTIFSATELGAGFRIAMKDLEIRGAGNLLGVEQHGHIAAVGFDLYSRLLSEAVQELKAKQGQPWQPKPRAERPAPTIDLPLAAHIPETYVSDVSARLGLYQRMGRIKEPGEVDDIGQELRDRFGEWPEPVENLLFMLKLKCLAAKAGVLSVSQDTGEIVLSGDERTWVGVLGVQRPYGDGVRIGHTKIRLDIRRLGNKWRQALEQMLNAAGKKAVVR